MQKHPRQMRLRQFMPPAFVMALLGGALLAPYSTAIRHFWFFTLAAYALANLVASLGTAHKGSWHHISLLPLVFATLHLSYGLGFLVGLVKFWNRYGTRRTDSLTLRSTLVEADAETSKR